MQGGDSNSTQTVDEMNVALNESETKCTDLRERLEETEERLREMQAAHEVFFHGEQFLCVLPTADEDGGGCVLSWNACAR